MDRDISYDVDGRVGVLTYTREPVNAFRYEDLEALGAVLSELPRDDELAVVLETGGDRTFSAGHDVNEFTATDVPRGDAATEIYMRTFERVYEFPVPLVAAVDGPAVGAGAILASLCDDRIVGPDAHVAVTEINVGIIGGLGPLRRVLPDGVARRLAYTGEELPAQRAYDLGFASEIDDNPQAAARDLARSVAENNPDAVRAAKASAVDGQPDWPLEEYRRAREYIDELRGDENASEAAVAFLEGREPDFE